MTRAITTGALFTSLRQFELQSPEQLACTALSLGVVRDARGLRP